MASVKSTSEDNYNIGLIAEYILKICKVLDLNMATESSKDTPTRVAKMYYNELFKNRNNQNIGELNDKMKTFPNEGYSDEPITVSNIRFNSVCEHHWLPFSGLATVEYIPDERILGLSKFPRVVKYFSQKPQLQERLTDEIGTYLVSLLKPKYLKVTLTASHCCVACRGAESDCETTTHFKYTMLGFEYKGV